MNKTMNDDQGNINVRRFLNKKKGGYYVKKLVLVFVLLSFLSWYKFNK